MPISKETFYDFLELIKLGHYELSKPQIDKAIKIYNRISNSNIKSIDDIEYVNDMNVDRRLTKRMMKRKIMNNEKKEMIFYLFRHGETNWNVESLIKGQMEDLKTTFTLSNSKYNELSKKGFNMKIKAIFTSDLFRTVQTANIINIDLDLPIYFYKNFRGLNMGKFEGKQMSTFLKNKVVKKAFADYNLKIPGGESINDLNNRFIQGLKNIYNNYNKVAIISHGAAISNIKLKISNEPYQDNSIIDYGNYKE